ncbi:MAG: hypothetical protein AABX14_05965 [Candidatus Aenigmatarchaeota archaeon]
MVCTKLSAGKCKITKKSCMQKYEIKMVRHKDCRIFKKGATKAKPKKITKKKRR